MLKLVYDIIVTNDDVTNQCFTIWVNQAIRIEKFLIFPRSAFSFHSISTNVTHPRNCLGIDYYTFITETY